MQGAVFGFRAEDFLVLASNFVFPAGNLSDGTLQLGAQFRHFEHSKHLPLAHLVADVHINVPDVAGDFCVHINDLIGLELPREVQGMDDTSLLHCGYGRGRNFRGNRVGPGIARNHTGEERQSQPHGENQGDSLYRISAMHLFGRFNAGRSHDNGLSAQGHASHNRSFGLNRMVLIVFSEEELGKGGRGTKKEGVQTWAAGNAPRAFGFPRWASQSRSGGEVKPR